MPKLGSLSPHLHHIWTLYRFGVAGLVNTIFGLSVIAGLDLGLQVDPHLANAAGFAVGIACGFMLHRGFVFRSDGHIGRAGIKYLTTVAFGFAANQGVLALATDLYNDMALGRLAAQLTGMATYTLLTFTLFRLWVFRDAEAPTSKT